MIFCQWIFEFLNQVPYIAAMIIPERRRILIVPDFDTDADDGMIPALREAIEARGDANVIVADLRKMVLDEHPGEKLQEAKVIELAARKLESLAEEGAKPAEETSQYETADTNGLTRTVSHDLGNGRILTIHVRRGSAHETGAPHTIVVFGRSAMLADGVGKSGVLFINPKYDSEWPWKKQYYAGRKAAEEYNDAKLHFHERIETAYSFGTVGYGPFPQPGRYGVFTTKEACKDDWDLNERYPRLSMVDTAVNDNVEAMAALICSFDDREMDIPLLEIDRLSMDLPRQQLLMDPEYFRFAEPIHVAGISAIAYGFEFRTPMGRGLSGLRVKIEGRNETVPIEAFTYYSNLSALRDAMVKTHEKAKELEKSIKRIMIVPDYFTPHDSPAVLELRRRLEEKGYRVTVFCAGNSLEKSRWGLERICKRRHYELILTLETGCLLAARIQGSHRIYVNPDWVAWEWMKRMLGEDKVKTRKRGERSGPFFCYRLDSDEIAMARDMGARCNIRRGEKLSAGWFTPDEADSHLPEGHMQRFGCAGYPPMTGLDTDAGINNLAKEIDKLMKSYEN